MIHLSFQAREQAVRLLWFAATGCPFPPLLPWKHMLDEAEPGTDFKYMISKPFAFPCKESFTSCFYKTLCEEEISLGKAAFWGVWWVLMNRFESITPEHVNVLSEVKCMRQSRDSAFWSGGTLAVAFGIRRVLLLCKLFALLSSPPWRGEGCTFFCTSGPQRNQICTCNSSMCSLGSPSPPQDKKQIFCSLMVKWGGLEKGSSSHRAVS